MLLIDANNSAATEAPLTRKELYRSIAQREAELAAVASAAFPEVIIGASPQRSRGARLLSVDQLKAIDRRLAEQIAEGQRALAGLREEQYQARRLVEEMLLDPQSYRGRRVSLREMGQPGCGVYRVVPRMGIIGRMRGWWCVKLSSGCP